MGSQATLVASSSASPTVSQLLEEVQPLVPPANFITTNLRIYDMDAFEVSYGNRSFCPYIFVDLDRVKAECNVDLSPYLA
ncbi:hypothetical protein QN277_006134 [Acacia crassicarpa]|uniref:Uncharacterized protein n=1 Tax=Acacia crassicarpa TaxID=499986 RepID=A0AAE1J154_9FABA|nr:hypothetical protein QN277_006134 [Acacia crassicarpa]